MAWPELLIIGVGLAVGSFLNVCIHRIPRGESILRPRSRCPHCLHPIAPWHNIPLLSYLLLRGRCAYCRQRISWIYPVVELLTASLFYTLYLQFGWTPPLLVNALFVSLLVVLVFIDLYERILPDLFTLGGTLAGFLLAPFQSPRYFTSWAAEPASAGSHYLASLLGILVGGGFLWAVAVLYQKLRKREGMGFGDIKMMAMVGAFLGWKYAWLTIFAGSLLGAVFGSLYILAWRRGRYYALPFGTFLGAGALLALFWGPQLLHRYLLP